MRFRLFFMLAALMALSPLHAAPLPVIFDTDMDSDVDDVADAGAGTRVTKGESVVSGRFPMIVVVALLAPWLTWETKRVFALDLARIKARLERAPEPA